MEGNTGDLLLRLERRLLAVEKKLRITPEAEDLLHPKSVRQLDEIVAARIRATQEKIK